MKHPIVPSATRAAALLVLAAGLAGCPSSPRVVLDDAGPHEDAAAPPDDAGLDADVVDAGLDVGDVDAATPPSCSSGSALAIAGDYVAPDGSARWLRESATAATYTIVPSGPELPSAPPQLFRIEEVCSGFLVLHEVDGAYARLDWASSGGSLAICVRAVSDAAAARSLVAADLSTGCAGGSWTSLVEVTP